MSAFSYHKSGGIWANWRECSGNWKCDQRAIKSDQWQNHEGIWVNFLLGIFSKPHIYWRNLWRNCTERTSKFNSIKGGWVDVRGCLRKYRTTFCEEKDLDDFLLLFLPSYHSPFETLTNHWFKCWFLLTSYSAITFSKDCLTFKYICYPTALDLLTLANQDIPK